MHKLVVILAGILIGSIAHAEQNDKVFNCMDKKSFEINSECMAKTIGNNIQFREIQHKIAENTQTLGDNVMASLTYFPKQRVIEVVAHPNATADNAGLAMIKRQD